MSWTQQGINSFWNDHGVRSKRLLALPIYPATVPGKFSVLRPYRRFQADVKTPPAALLLHTAGEGGQLASREPAERCHEDHICSKHKSPK